MSESLVAGQYAIDFSRRMEDAGGGLVAFAASDRRAQQALMAVQVRAGLPPRARIISALLGATVEGALLPLAHGPAAGPDGASGYFVICQAPPGPRLALDRPWGEGDLIENVLRPAAAALDGLHGRRVTHRAIRPDNLFRAAFGGPATLGCAWAAPAASLQPALFEPPYSGCCLPAGRGDGSIADDVYALGVTLLVLALGRSPLPDLDDEAILRRKLDLGSYAALTGGVRLPPVLSDLLRSMLAEDPDHRPLPVLLTNPSVARARRVATRPPRRAQWALELGEAEAWNARTLAHLLARDPPRGAQMLRSGAVGDWLRRSLGDATLAARIEENNRAGVEEVGAEGSGASWDEAMSVLRAAAALDPLAPLWWRGVALWPEGVGPALAAAVGTPAAAAVEELVGTEAVTNWASARAERCDVASLRQEARQNRFWLRLRGPEGGVPRLLYGLNPLAPCASPLLAGQWVARLGDLLPALEVAAGRPEVRKGSPIDRHVAAFIAARSDLNMGRDLALLAEEASSGRSPLAQLRLLSGLQTRFRLPPLPGLTRWMAEACVAAPSSWRNRSRRRRMEEKVVSLQDAGRLADLLALIDDPQERDADERGAREAEQAAARIDHELAALEEGAELRAEEARRLGREIAAGSGMLATLLAIVALCL
jgi:hypothetical protein